MSMKPKAPSDKALGEFLSEAQDILESLGHDLMLIDRSAKADREPDPDLVNNLFRGFHTLKSLSGMFGVEPLAALAHHEEALLEEVRLGRIVLGSEILDLLFESLEVITLILGVVGGSEEAEETAIEKRAKEFVATMARAAGHETEVPGDPLVDDPLSNLRQLFGSEVIEVLTEYEEHRLKTNLSRGLPIFRVCMWFDLDSIDVNLEEIRAKLKPIGEIITYLPSSEESEAEKLGIDIILALYEDQDTLRETLKDHQVELREIVGSGAPTEGAGGPTAPPAYVTESAQAALPEEEQTKLPGPAVTIPPQGLAPAEEAEQSLSLRSVSQTVRVDIRKLDHLMNFVGELSIIRAAIAKISEEIGTVAGRSDLTIELHRINRGFERRLTALREGILEVRMVPLGQMFDRLSRMVRKISHSLEKEIHFLVSGADTEVDKLITEELSDPLMHLIRNAIDHGVEMKEQRSEAGKPEFGTVALTAYQKGSHVVIEVEDDGSGIDDVKLREVAVQRGVIDTDLAEEMSTREISNLIFLPGISTSDQATEISGRGVGMDVVKTNIAALGGVIEIHSERGIGTKFSITLPVTLAIIPALLVGVSDMTYAVPLNTVAEALFVSDDEIRSMMGVETIALRGETLVLCRLSEFFGSPRGGFAHGESCVVVARLGQRRLGLIVDTLYGQQDVVIKTMGPSMDSAVYFSGATDIGDERLALVLDTSSIIDDFFSSSDGRAQPAELP